MSSDSEISVLTNLSEDDDIYSDTEYIEPTQSPKKKRKASSSSNTEYPSHCLEKPSTTTYAAESLYRQICENIINLNPEYQRDIVWSETKQSNLIDSMIKNYHIPPIVFAVNTDEKGRETRTCIDGKQRLTSLRMFMDGVIPCKDPGTNEKWWYKPSKSQPNSKILSPIIIQQLNHKQITCNEYTRLTDDDEREIFQRVQLGVVLTPAEKMHSVKSPWATLVRQIINSFFPSNSSAQNGNSSVGVKRKLEDIGQLIKLKWSMSRGRIFQFIAIIIYFVEKETQSFETAPKYPHTSILSKWLSRTTTPSGRITEKVNKLFTVFVLIARNESFTKVFLEPRRISPAEFIMVGVLLSLKMYSYTLEMLAMAISKMRSDVRKAYQDIRSNTKVIGHMFGFIYNKLQEDSELTVNTGERVAAEIARSIQIGVPPSSTAMGSGNRTGLAREKKRRRNEMESEDDYSNEKDIYNSEVESEPEPSRHQKKRGRPRTPPSQKNAASVQMVTRSMARQISSSTPLLNSTTNTTLVSQTPGAGSSSYQIIDLTGNQQPEGSESELEGDYMSSRLTRVTGLSTKGHLLKNIAGIKQEDKEPAIMFETMIPTLSINPNSSPSQLAGHRFANTRFSLARGSESNIGTLSINSTNNSFSQPFMPPVISLPNTDASKLLEMISNGTLQAQLEQIAQTASTPAFNDMPVTSQNHIASQISESLLNSFDTMDVEGTMPTQNPRGSSLQSASSSYLSPSATVIQAGSAASQSSSRSPSTVLNSASSLTHKSVHWNRMGDRDTIQTRASNLRPRPVRRFGRKNDINLHGEDRLRSPNQDQDDIYRNGSELRVDEDGVRFVRNTTSASRFDLDDDLIDNNID